jgi:hypothetical protein
VTVFGSLPLHIDRGLPGLPVDRARKRRAKMSGFAGDPVACRAHRMRRKNPLLHGMSQFLWGCDCCALKFSTGYDGLVPRKLPVLSCGSGVSGCVTVGACACVRACVQTSRHSRQQCASATDRSLSTVAKGDGEVNPATEEGPREARDRGRSTRAEGGEMVAEGAEQQQEGQEEEEGGRSSNLRTAEGAEEQQEGQEEEEGGGSSNLTNNLKPAKSLLCIPMIHPHLVRTHSDETTAPSADA